MKRAQLAINSVSTKGANLEERLAAYSGAGFRHVEFVIGQIKEYLKQGHTLADVRRLLDQYQLKCIGGFECGLECFSPAEKRQANHDLIVANAKLLAELGGTGMVVGTDGPGAGVADPIGEMACTLNGVAKRLEGTGVTICVEFNWSPIIKSMRTAVDLAKRSGAPNVGVLFDPAHYHCTPTKFEMITAASVPFVKHLHMNDMSDKPGELSNCNSDRVLPGQGCLDLRGLIGALEKYGYSGYCSIEMFNADLWAMPAADAAKLMYQSLLPYCTD